MATPRRPDASERGIPCPRCGCTHHYTRRTLNLPGGLTRRLRECRHCGRQFQTTERVYPQQLGL